MIMQLLRPTIATLNHIKQALRQERNGHRIRWFVILVTLLSAGSVAAAYAFSSENAQAMHSLDQRYGAQVLTSSELQHAVKQGKFVAYWLGPISGSKYTLIATGDGVVTVTYLSGGSGINNPYQNNLVFETVTKGNLKDALIAPNTEVDNTKESIVTGNSFSYDRYLMDHMTVSISGDERKVYVFYPQLHSAFNMQTDAEALQKVE